MTVSQLPLAMVEFLCTLFTVRDKNLAIRACVLGSLQYLAQVLKILHSTNQKKYVCVIYYLLYVIVVVFGNTSVEH